MRTISSLRRDTSRVSYSTKDLVLPCLIDNIKVLCENKNSMVWWIAIVLEWESVNRLPVFDREVIEHEKMENRPSQIMNLEVLISNTKEILLKNTLDDTIIHPDLNSWLFSNEDTPSENKLSSTPQQDATMNIQNIGAVFQDSIAVSRTNCTVSSETGRPGNLRRKTITRDEIIRCAFRKHRRIYRTRIKLLLPVINNRKRKKYLEPFRNCTRIYSTK